MSTNINAANTLGLTLTNSDNYDSITFGEWVQAINGEAEDSNIAIVANNIVNLQDTVATIGTISSINGEAMPTGELKWVFETNENGHLLLTVTNSTT